MRKTKAILKEIVSKFFFSFLKKPEIRVDTNKASKIWTGDYPSWKEAETHTSGYDSATILEKCQNALLKVKDGDAVYERDGVLFDEIQYSWPLLAGLQRAASENKGQLCVLDFGGSLGSSYYQNRHFLNTLNVLQWCIVEQKNFVDCGKKFFEEEELRFYSTVEECIFTHKPNVLILSSVLQYLEKPYEWIEKFVALRIPYIIIDRTTFVKSERDILTIQNVPEHIYQASYPAWFFNIDRFVDHFKNYSVLASFDAHQGYVIHLENGLTSTYKGYILKFGDDC